MSASVFGFQPLRLRAGVAGAVMLALSAVILAPVLSGAAVAGARWLGVAGLDATFTATGAGFTAAEGTRLGFGAVAVGRDDAAVPLGAPAVVRSASRVAYDYPGVQQWFVRSDQGTEHGFTLQTPPDGDGPVRIVQELTGGLLPVPAGEDGLRFVAPDGSTTIGYRGLHAFDAVGRVLPATVTTESGRLVLEVDDTDATYPIVVDPMISERPTSPRTTGPPTTGSV